MPSFHSPTSHEPSALTLVPLPWAQHREREQQLFLTAGPKEEGREFARQDKKLQIIKQYREGSKRKLVNSLLQNQISTEVHIYPSFGQTVFFEHAFENPYEHEERFAIVCPDPELRPITNDEQWLYYRKALKLLASFERVHGLRQTQYAGQDRDRANDAAALPQQRCCSGPATTSLIQQP